MAAHVERLIRIYNRLRRGPVTIEIITKWAAKAGIEVSSRQLYRDLNQLKNLQIAEGENVVEYTDEKNKKTWKLEYEENAGKLTTYDINSFFLLKNFAPYAVLDERKSSFEKIEKIIYKGFSKNSYQKYVEANELFLRATNFSDNKYGAAEHKQIEDLIWALHNSRCIIIEADAINVSNTKFRESAFPIKMYPLELIFHRGRIVISGATDFKSEVNFTIDIDFKYSLTNQAFKRSKYLKQYKIAMDNNFGLATPINDKLYNIKLEFTDSYALSMQRFILHHTQVWKPQKNGNSMLYLRCGISRELVGFLAAGLDKIKVHQPKILRDFMNKKYAESIMVNNGFLDVNEERANGDY
jgi:hypothetical protein